MRCPHIDKYHEAPLFSFLLSDYCIQPDPLRKEVGVKNCPVDNALAVPRLSNDRENMWSKLHKCKSIQRPAWRQVKVGYRIADSTFHLHIREHLACLDTMDEFGIGQEMQ